MKGQKNLTLEVYDRIKQMMLNYELIPGQRLIFVDLAKELGVSRTPVNNALSILAKEGYLDFIPNQGYSIHKLTKEEAECLYEAREIVEIGVISKAIRMMTDEKLAVFEERKKDFENSISNRVTREMFILDTEFHATLVDVINNNYLSERYRHICQKIFLRFRVEELKIERIPCIAEEHQELFDAVRIKDVDLTKELVRKHYNESKEHLFPILFLSNGKLS